MQAHSAESTMVERESEKGGGCVMSYLKTKNGFNVATYKWSPPCGDDASIGCVFLMHGIFAVRHHILLSLDLSLTLLFWLFLLLVFSYTLVFWCVCER